MPAGTIIYDKSILESLTEDETLLFHRYFHTNITPVIFLEILADLKETPRSESLKAEEVVSLLANKLPITMSAVNAHYLYLCQGELNNITVPEAKVPMTGRVIASQKPRTVSAEDGKKGYIYKDSVEETALRRLREKKYSELDSLLAERWKSVMKELNLDTLANSLKKEFSHLPRFKNLNEIKIYVEETLVFIDQKKPVLLLIALLEQFNASTQIRSKTINSWQSINNRTGEINSILSLLPYSSYILKVDLFYKIALSQRLVESSKKSKSHIDLQYLYYLPFCQIFFSKDKFHRKVVPLFLREDQIFVWGEDIKSDLLEYNKYIKGLSSEDKAKYDYKAYPPDFPESTICKIFDQYNKGWRSHAKAPIKISKEEEKRIVEELRRRMEESKNIEEKPGEEPEWMVKEILMTKEELKKTFNLSDSAAQEIIDKENNKNKKDKHANDELYTKLSQDFKETLISLEKECIDSIELCFDSPATTKEQCLFILNVAVNSLLRRIINIAKQYSIFIDKKELLSAAIQGRALVETVAHFHYLLNEIERNLKLKKSPEVYYLLASYILGGNHGFNNDKQKLKKLNILDSLRNIEKTYPQLKILETYTWLCEFVHPNSMGTTFAFSRLDKENHIIKFFDSNPSDKILSPLLEASIYLPIFQHDWERLEGIRNLIISTWEPSESLCDLFEN